jgi:hypothetical protein
MRLLKRRRRKNLYRSPRPNDFEAKLRLRDTIVKARGRCIG